MKIEKIISTLMELQKLYPEADVYFTDNIDGAAWETYFDDINVDEENNEIEVMFNTK